MIKKLAKRGPLRDDASIIVGYCGSPEWLAETTGSSTGNSNSATPLGSRAFGLARRMSSGLHLPMGKRSPVSPTGSAATSPNQTPQASPCNTPEHSRSGKDKGNFNFDSLAMQLNAKLGDDPDESSADGQSPVPGRSPASPQTFSSSGGGSVLRNQGLSEKPPAPGRMQKNSPLGMRWSASDTPASPSP